jgi:predicted nucleotidyltransferase
MPQILVDPKSLNSTQKAILSTLSFFHIYKLPLSAEKIWQLLYKKQASFQEVKREIDVLTAKKIIARNDSMYSLVHFDSWQYHTNQMEIKARWKKIKRYHWILSSLPFVEEISVINSVAMGNADAESDIDFFVITKPKRLYFVRTVIIVLFKLLGVYKTRTKINKRFCFGFYMTSDNLSIRNLLLHGDDPYMAFWIGTMIPITGARVYERFIKENRWVYSYLPNFNPQDRYHALKSLRQTNPLKMLLTIVCYLPALVLEPFLRQVHVRHTFKLPENHWKTSSTIANRQMLKLHALDPRLDLRTKFEEIERNLYR